MPIVIMKTTESRVYRDWVRPHCIWEGDKKSANIWCHEKSLKSKDGTTYEAVTVKTEKPKCKQNKKPLKNS